MFIWRRTTEHEDNLGPAIGPELTGFIVRVHLTPSSTLYLYFVFNLAYSSQQIDISSELILLNSSIDLYGLLWRPT